MTDLLPDIENYLESIDDDKPVDIKNLKELILKIRTYTGISVLASELIVKEFFQQIRNEIIKENSIELAKLGRFYSVKKNRNKIVKFKLAKRILTKLNE
jgi:nucleoid DNA-binding protein